MQLGRLFETVTADVRYAARGFRHNLGFALTAVVALAIGIGSASAVFSVVDRILFRPLRYPQEDRLVTFGLLAPIEQREFMLSSDYLRWRRHQAPFISVTSFRAGGTDCDITAQPPMRQQCAFVESSFLPTFGIQPLLGRNFSPEEDRPNAPGVALISYGLWKSRFRGEPDVVGKSFSLDGNLTTIAGVLRPDFEFPTLAPVDILVPLQLDEARQQRPNAGTVLRAYARLKPGVTVKRATDALQPLFQDSLQSIPALFRKDVKVSVRLLRDLQTENVRIASWVLFGAVLAVLLIACANVANLLLARFVDRQREFAVRAALGAGRWRLIRHSLTESLLLGIAGGVAGCVLAFWLLKVFVTLAPQGIPRLSEASLDVRVLLFGLVATVLSAIVFGLAPALQNPRADSLAGRHAVGGGRSFLRPALAATQLAVSLILLTAASLLLQSLRRIEAVPLGIETETVLTASIGLSAANYSQTAQQQEFFEELEARLRQIPGITALGISDSLPPSGAMHGSPFNGLEVAGEPPRARDEAGGGVGWRLVTPGYFPALRIPILRGRAFREEDRDSRENVIILSDRLARRLLPNQDLLDRRIALYRGSPWFRVIGIAGNVKNAGILVPDDPEYYVLRKHIVANHDAPVNTVFRSGRHANIIVRSAQSPKGMADWIRAEVASVDPTLPVTIEPLDQRVGRLTAVPRFNAALLSLFAAAGVALAAVGLYGVISFLVVQRTQEIGVRMALGATPGRIAQFVLARAGQWAAVGIVVGMAGSYLAARLMRALLYQVRPSDPVTLIAVTALLLTIALAAAWIPARRAMHLDPIVALRYE